MTKQQWKTHLTNYWLVYAIWIVIAIFISNWLVGLAVAPSKEEKISVFVSTQSIDSESVVATAKQVEMPTILEVETNVVASSDYLMTYVSAFLKDYTDIALFSKTDMDKIIESYEGLFVEIDTIAELANEENVFYTTQSGKKLGIKIDNFAENETEETYYLFISKLSIHIGSYNDDSVDNYAISVAKQLLGAK